jgi:hypothetical protein
LSYVVTGTAKLKSREVIAQQTESAEYFQHIVSTSLAVEINVQRVCPLIDTLALAAPDYMFRLPMFGNRTGDSMPVWLDSENIKSAHVGDYIYLTTQSYEVQLEALVRITDNQVVLAYHHYWPPCEMECVILKNSLCGDERSLFEHLISIAEPISDSHKGYLV